VALGHKKSVEGIAEAMCLGVPGQIVEIVDAAKNLAKADFAGVRRTINIACIVTPERPAEACLGDWVLVHVGFAMGRIDEDEAKKTLAMFESLGEELPPADAPLSAPAPQSPAAADRSR
jgi:hydrogenase expression/formation protein HypC